MALLDKAIERRNFLKGTAAAAATVAAAGLAGCVSDDNAGADDGEKARSIASDTAILEDRGEWVTVECWQNCGGRCQNKVYVADGVVVRQKTNDNQEDTLETPQQRSCPRGHSLRQHVFNVDRIKYPMKRKSWQPGGGENAHGELRGAEGWERLSWDDALDLVAQEFVRVYDQYGPRSVVNMGTDWPILNLMGGMCQWNSTESYGNWYNAPVRMGTDQGIGPDCSLVNDRLDMKNADTIVLYGLNPAWHSSGNPAYYYRLAKEAGAEFVIVGPDYNVSASMLEARWIRVRPSTDTAFLLSVAYEMILLDEEGESVVDWEFLHKYCVGFDAVSMPEAARLDENFKDYVLGEYDGIPKTAEWASEICGTPVEDIKWYAAKMSKKFNVTLLHSYAPSRHRGAIDLAQLFLTIACMGGHLGKPGNACGSTFSVESANGGTKLVKMGNPSKSTSVKNPLERPHICKSDIWESILNGVYYNRGQYMNGEIDNAFLPQQEIKFDPRIIVSDYHNPLQATEDINTGIKAFRAMDMVVCIDYRYTLTVQYADVVFPCTTAWEGNLDKSEGPIEVTGRRGMLGLTKNQVNRDIALFTRPAVKPLFEARPDTWIYTELANRMGVDATEVFPISDVQAYFDKIAGTQVLDADGKTYNNLVRVTQADMDAWGVEGDPHEGLVDFQELMKEGIYIVPRSDGDNYGYIGYKDFIEDPEANPRKSESGKIEIYCQSKADAINGIGYAAEELKPYPTFHETPYQQTFANWDLKEKGEYPFLMYQPHYLRRSHTNFDNNSWTQEALQNPVFINAQDAAAKGIKTGDTVLVFNHAGKLLRQASVTNLVMPGAVALPHGPRSYIDPETGIDRGGNENMVVDKATQDEFFPHCNGYNSCMVDFDKYDGEPLIADCLREPALWTEE